jgi:hypothetical protein
MHADYPPTLVADLHSQVGANEDVELLRAVPVVAFSSDRVRMLARRRRSACSAELSQSEFEGQVSTEDGGERVGEKSRRVGREAAKRVRGID